MQNILRNHSYTILFLVCTLLFSLFFLISSGDKEESRTVIVSSGDTIWKLAERYSTKDMSREEAVNWIQKENHINDGSIRAGDKLIVPKNSSTEIDNLAGDF